jgi:hypothetical protein
MSLLVSPNVRAAWYVGTMALFVDIMRDSQQDEDGFWRSERMEDYFAGGVVFSTAVRDAIGT